MKITTGLVVEIRRNGEFMSGIITMNGIRQDVRNIPRNIELNDLLKFFSDHIEPKIVSGQHGSVSYRKGKDLQ